jgi:hypothetical protein
VEEPEFRFFDLFCRCQEKVHSKWYSHYILRVLPI